MAIILSITGSDGTGGSGIQADIKTISSLGGRAVSAITSITMQNTLGIQSVYDLPAAAVRGQIEAIINDVQPDTMRIGLVRNAETLAVVVETLQKYRPKFVVYDPVITASNGDELLSDDVVALIRCKLLPLCSIVVLRERDKEKFTERDFFEDTRVIVLDNPHGHGFSNVFSSALAVYLNTEKLVNSAIAKAMDYANTFVKHEVSLIGRSAQLYNEFLTAVQQHNATNRDVAFYADCLNVSPTYLSQVTHKVSGNNPKNIIDKALTETISNRLLSTMLTIQEVAYNFKFGSQAQFTKYFKKQTGLTPSEFRRRNSKR
ncbi:bifunctional hydroxymethylpyrimidine kinase/phosphomethylpyrimidine kinase [Prevotella amnii]|uniref:Thiamine-phosphate pyrophosphorylase n=1 Tax=Prevotella amnii DNF00058 TaxID=1401066 RepID=A0A096B2S0_9BACT|nr:bifunctional hydroxymethylpyrimidine kinase/phosphomethylpyrimidine kinase [Prevotella amnii]KGF53315.1 thiamine-phosphate pyrophosphorylase [Prevotella amnii DNF00058]